MDRLLCVLIGYLFGSFLTAEVVARAKAGKTARDIGSGNPGAANMASHLGIGWGLATLLGDVLKTAAACFLCRFQLFPALGGLAGLYAGLGAALGHNYPVWNRFRGGKGIAVTCAFLVFFSPLWGMLACLGGLCLVLATGYLYVGAIAIPALFLPAAFVLFGAEAALLVLAALLLMLLRVWPELKRVAAGQAKKTGLRTWLRRK